MEKHQFTENLSKLRLRGMTENLDMRLREAEENQLGYLEFLSLLVQDELAKRDANSFSKSIRQANFGQEKTFEQFDFKFNESVIEASKLRDLATCRFIDLKESVCLSGPPGIGKTHIIKAIGHEACRKKYSVYFSKVYRFFEEFENEMDLQRRAKVWKKFVTSDLLLLDDFGFKKMTVKETELFYMLVDSRLSRGALIITSNRPPEDWPGIFPDPVIGGAILDRVVSAAHKIIVTSTDAKSFRREGEKN